MQIYAKYQFDANKMIKIYRITISFNFCLHFYCVLRLLFADYYLFAT